MNIGDYFGRGSLIVSSGDAAVSSAILGNGHLGMQWPSEVGPAKTAAVLDRILYGFVARGLVTNAGGFIFVFDANAVPADGAVADVGTSLYKYCFPIDSGVQEVALNYGTSGAYFKNGCVLVASSTDFPTLTNAAVALAYTFTFQYDRPT